MRLFLDLFVLDNDKLLDGLHLITEALNGDELVVWLGLLNLVEDLKDVVVLGLHLHQAQFLLLVFAYEGVQFATLLNLVQ